MTASDRAYLLERCLRLEAELARPGRRRWIVHPSEIQGMVAMRRQGATVEAIAEQYERHFSTVRRLTKGWKI